jgi:predicted nucleotidyltransferase
MKPSDALRRHREAVLRLLRQAELTNPRIFGSVLSQQDREGSDLDILVDAAPGTTLFDLGGLQVELEALVGVPVDLLVPGDLPKRSRAKILAQAQPL